MRLVLPLLSLTTMLASPGTACEPTKASSPLHAAVSCAPTAEPLVYRCSLTLLDATTKAPACVGAGSINFDMPSMPMVHHIPQVALATKADGTMQWETRIDMHGQWRMRISTGTATIVRLVDFQPDRAEVIR